MGTALEIQAVALLEIIAARAVAGERMPTGDELSGAGIGSPKDALDMLTAAGHIRREVGGRNWRVVEILTGEHKGKRTAQPKGKWNPYRIIDKNGNRYVSARPAPRTMPSGAKSENSKFEDSRQSDEPAPVTLPKLSFMDG